MAVVASGSTTGAMMRWASSMAVGLGWCTSTGIGCRVALPAPCAGVFAAGVLAVGRSVVELAAHAAHDAFHATQGKLLDGADLPLDGRGVERHLGHQIGDLRANERANRQHHPERDQDSQQHGGDAGHVDVAQQVDQRGEHKGQQDRQRDRDQHGSAEIQPGDDHHSDRKRQQAGQTGCFRGRHLGLVVLHFEWWERIQGADWFGHPTP